MIVFGIIMFYVKTEEIHEVLFLLISAPIPVWLWYMSCKIIFVSYPRIKNALATDWNKKWEECVLDFNKKQQMIKNKQSGNSGSSSSPTTSNQSTTIAPSLQQSTNGFLTTSLTSSYTNDNSAVDCNMSEVDLSEDPVRFSAMMGQQNNPASLAPSPLQGQKLNPLFDRQNLTISTSASMPNRSTTSIPNILHAVLIPNYKESEIILSYTLESCSKYKLAKTSMVIVRLQTCIRSGGETLNPKLFVLSPPTL